MKRCDGEADRGGQGGDDGDQDSDETTSFNHPRHRLVVTERFEAFIAGESCVDEVNRIKSNQIQGWTAREYKTRPRNESPSVSRLPLPMPIVQVTLVYMDDVTVCCSSPPGSYG